MNEETARLLGQARGYEFAGRPDEAKECFREILRRHPGNVSLLFQGGVVYLKARDYREAERCFDEILKTVPDHHGALLNKAACCIFTGRGAGAVGYYEQVIGLVPTAMDPRINLIRLLLQLQWHDEAIRQCDAALGMDPGNMIVAGLRQACGAGGSPVSPAPPPTPPWNPGPAMLRAAILQGRQLALAGKKAEAVRWFDDLIARLPQQSADLWVERGIAVNMSQHAGPVSLSRTDDI
jgi:tetratricopeptide (TPR) repeat protein